MTATNSQSQKPTHRVSTKNETVGKTQWENIGVVWQREDGGMYIKLYGKQVVDQGLYVFPIDGEKSEGEGQ